VTTATENLVQRYTAWLRDSIVTRQQGEWLEINAPYLDRHNDHLQVYIQARADGTYVMTDDGNTIADLAMSGVDLDTETRHAFLNTALRGFNVKRDGNDLTVVADERTFPHRLHSLLQAMISVDDLFYTAQPHVTAMFYEDVEKWLRDHHVRFAPHLNIQGRSGYTHQFDFVIPFSDTAPERIIQTINNPSKERVLVHAMRWADVRDVRPESVAYAVVNDEGRHVEAAVDALKAWDIAAIRWTGRGTFIDQLAG
jgi:hypothetical protein